MRARPNTVWRYYYRIAKNQLSNDILIVLSRGEQPNYPTCRDVNLDVTSWRDICVITSIVERCNAD